jgi:hypothetical protein
VRRAFRCFLLAVGASLVAGVSTASGHVASNQHLAAIAIQPGDVVHDGNLVLTVPVRGEEVSIDVDAELANTSFGIRTNPDGSVVLIDAGNDNSSSTLPALTSSIRLLTPNVSSVSPCDQIGVAYTGWIVSSNGGFHYRINSGSFPGELDTANTIQAIRDAGTNITTVNNDCGFGDSVSATIAYDGTTSHGVDMHQDASDTTTCDSSSNRDGVSVVGFGTVRVSGIPLRAGTCTWASSNGLVLESDLRYNKTDFNWVVNPGSSCSGKFGVEDVGTHERGHTFGLDHPDIAGYSPSQYDWLTMAPIAYQCQDSHWNHRSTLGLGDKNGLKSLY